MTFEQALKAMKKGKKVIVNDDFAYPIFWIENGEIIGKSLTLHGFPTPKIDTYVLSNDWEIYNE